jgi:hypothetical protein
MIYVLYNSLRGIQENDMNRMLKRQDLLSRWGVMNYNEEEDMYKVGRGAEIMGSFKGISV